MANVSGDTLLTCEIVLRRFLDVMCENPDCAAPEFKDLVNEAFLDVQRARNQDMLMLTRAARAVPAETPQASLLQPGATVSVGQPAA